MHHKLAEHLNSRNNINKPYKVPILIFPVFIIMLQEMISRRNTEHTIRRSSPNYLSLNINFKRHKNANNLFNNLKRKHMHKIQNVPSIILKKVTYLSMPINIKMSAAKNLSLLPLHELPPYKLTLLSFPISRLNLV